MDGPVDLSESPFSRQLHASATVAGTRFRISHTLIAIIYIDKTPLDGMCVPA